MTTEFGPAAVYVDDEDAYWQRVTEEALSPCCSGEGCVYCVEGCVCTGDEVCEDCDPTEDIALDAHMEAAYEDRYDF